MLEPIEVVDRIQEILLREDVVEALADEAGFDEFQREMADLIDPGFSVRMIGPDYTPQRVEAHGLEGFNDAWKDWTSPFEAFKIEIDEVVETGEGRVLTLVHQRGRTKVGGVEIGGKAAAVWTVREGRLVAVEFHLDQDVARRAAGLEAHSRQE